MHAKLKILFIICNIVNILLQYWCKTIMVDLLPFTNIYKVMQVILKAF